MTQVGFLGVESYTRGGGTSQLDRELSRLTTEAEHAAAQLGETRERLVTAEARTSELQYTLQHGQPSKSKRRLLMARYEAKHERSCNAGSTRGEVRNDGARSRLA